MVELEQAGEDFLIADIGRPTVGGKDGPVEFAVSVLQPRGTFVVEIGEGALL